MKAALLLFFLLGFLAIRIPVVYCMLLSAGIYLLFFSDIPIVVMAQRMGGVIESFPILAVPLFILAAEFMNRGKSTTRIFKFASHLVGHIRGSLGHINVVASMIFAGMSGSEIADTAGLGKIEIKAMTEKGYDTEFSAAITGASSIIGPIVPPSIPMIVYGSIGEQSVGRLFLAGAIPGVIMGLALMVLVYFMSKRRNYPREEFPGLKSLGKSFIEAFPTLLVPIIIMGGIMAGIFTPTEAGGVAAAYTFILTFIVYRDLPLKDVFPIFYEVSLSTAMILIIMGGAAVFSWVITLEQVPVLFRNFIVGFTKNPWIVLLIINIIVLIAGCFFGAMTILLIMTPMLIPLAKTFGIDLIHLGVVMVLNLCVGYLTPPFGLGLFILSDITGVSVERLSLAMIPFYVPILIVLLLVTYFPILALFLPNLLMGS